MKDKATLVSFAKCAADAYLGKNKTPLSDSLKKTASSEALSPPQIEFMTTEANKEVWTRLYGMDKTASYKFEPVDSTKVIDSLKLSHKPVVINEGMADYSSAPTKTAAEFDPYKAFGIEKKAEETGMSRKEVRRELNTRLEKLAHLKNSIECDQIVCNTKIADGELNFIKQARAIVLDQPFSERGQAVEKIAEFVRGVNGSKEVAKDLMRKLSHVLKRQGLIKEADLKAPEEYISDKLPAKIINGRHALYITIKTLMENHDDGRSLASRHEIVDSSLPVLREKIREL